MVTIQNPKVHFINQSQNASGYIWSFGDNTGTSTVVNPTHIFPNNEENKYIVQLIATNVQPACNDTAKMIVQVKEPLIFYIPNTFTPDNDDYNPTFQPVFTSGFNPYNYTLLIYNRWGELIFVSHNAKVGWDGTYGGKLVPDGTYVWKIKFAEKGRDKHQIKVGHVNIVR